MTPPRRAIYPLGRFTGMAATGGIYAAPTTQPVIFIIIYARGRGLPRPYGVVNFVVAISRDGSVFPAGL